MEAEANEKQIFWLTAIVLSALSTVGCSVVVGSVLLTARQRKLLNGRLIAYLSSADLLLSFICLIFCVLNYREGHIPTLLSHPRCQAQFVVTWYAIQSTIFWLAIMAVSNYILICAKHDNLSRRMVLSPTYEVAASILAWGFPLLTTIVPLHTGTLHGSRGGLWCSYNVDSKVVQAVMLAFYYIIGLAVILSCYYRIFSHLSQPRVSPPPPTEETAMNRLEEQGQHISFEGDNYSSNVEGMKRSCLYVMSYLLVWSPMFGCFIWEAVHGDTVTFWAEYVSANLIHVQGILNVTLYGIKGRVVDGILQRLRLLPPPT